MFEQFKMRDGRGGGMVDCVTLSFKMKGGFLMVASNLCADLKNPEHVTLHIDRESKIFGLKAAEKRDLFSRRLTRIKNGIASKVACREFISALGLMKGDRFRVDAKFDSSLGMIVGSYADIKNAPVPGQ